MGGTARVGHVVCEREMHAETNNKIVVSRSLVVDGLP